MMLFFLCFRNLFRNIRRTVAILLTVAFGAGALFCFQGFINGVLTDYQRTTIHSHYGDGQFNTTGYRESAWNKPWEHWIGNWKEIKTTLAHNPDVKFVFPRVPLGGMLIHDKSSITGQGMGVDAKEEAQFFNALNIEQGQPLTGQTNGIVLGKGLASALDVHPGDKITLYTKSTTGSISKGKFTVTGIFHTGIADYDNHAFQIQLEEAQKLLKTEEVESIAVGLTTHAAWNSASQSLLSSWPHLEAASFAELDKVYYQHAVDWLKTQFYVVQMIIISIVLLGIFNSISTAILERKQEIGNLRANGESAWDVMKLILCEGALLGLLGSLIGLALTALVAKGLLHQQILMPPGPGSTRQSLISFYFTCPMAIQTLALGVLSSIAASFLAGLKVARMPIAKALRSF
jgi:putative ABC transport system permease protein